MISAYWLAFALTLTPIFMQIVATVLIWPAFSSYSRRRKADAATKRSLPAAWPYFLLALFAFGLMLWQTTYVSDLFALYSYDYGVEQVDVLGVSIPLELGETVRRFVDSAFALLFSLGFTTFFVWMFVSGFKRTRKEPGAKAGILGWIFGIIFFGCIVFAVWTMWRGLPYQLENLRALF